MTTSEHDTRRQLEAIENYLARVTDHLRRIEGERDRLILALSDLEGAPSNRFAGIR